MFYKKIIEKIKFFFLYWYNKRLEIKKIKFRDVKQAYIITQIELLSKSRMNKYIMIEKTFPLHSINRKTSMHKLKERIIRLKKTKKLGIKKTFSVKELDKIMPSITKIKVTKINDKYLVWEGNGRVEALKKVFNNCSIEVENYILEKKYQNKILKLFYDLDK